MLPVNDYYKPDWQFMENYIKERASKIVFEKKLLPNFVQTQFVQNKKWKEFKVSDIFKYKKIKKYSKTPLEKGNINFITSSGQLNGIKTKIQKEIVLKKGITVSTNGACFSSFYQDKKFWISSDVEVLFNKNINKFNALFIIPFLNENQKIYNYARKPKNQKVFKTFIYLPVNKQNKPDWQFMEDYIKERSKQILF